MDYFNTLSDNDLTSFNTKVHKFITRLDVKIINFQFSVSESDATTMYAVMFQYQLVE